MTEATATQTAMAAASNSLSDNEFNAILDEIDENEEQKEIAPGPQALQRQQSDAIFKSLKKRESFSTIKQTVFEELHDRDHIAQERISWYNLQRWVEFEWLDKLYQENELKQHFIDDIEKAKVLFASYTDKILIKYFQCPFKADANNEAAQAFITNATNDDAFVHYNFPYFFAEGIHHYVLFSRYDIIHSLGHKQMHRLIANYVSADARFVDQDYEFVYYEEREKLSFFNADRDCRLLSDVVNGAILPNIIHIFVMIPSKYRVHLGGNNATWTDETFLWDDTVEIIKSGKMELFGREERWLRKYIQDRSAGKKPKKPAATTSDETKDENPKPKPMGFNSVRDKILIKEFGCKSMVNAENNKLKAIVDETTPRMLWTENLYPYAFEKGIEHHLCWYLDESVEEDVLRKFIEKHLGTQRTYVFWENPLHLKSIPDLDHFQIVSVDMKEYLSDIKHILRSEPYKWSEFAANDDIVKRNECKVGFGFDERISRRYVKEMKEIELRFTSTLDADLRRYFKCKVIKDAFGKLTAFDDKVLSAVYDYRKYRFVLNPYRFHLEPGLTQYLLIIRDKEAWSKNKVKQIIKAELTKLDRGDQKEKLQFVFWEKMKTTINLW
eukprot:CAMPEP_0202690654 /NCGR_PEP_ID=MMETSP1385-20130828/5581_1 /ASSEMBLY_ACC=CAM_ASM_000861 /TAXON_ID=933848 /ORGANISM="Elphidium margaritaceum" /LENGTH=610 /DNA_ID=CAMNT_0049345935 /DNA_START=52 /DNA_END=1881 /DNA_ORIENTATION=+